MANIPDLNFLELLQSHRRGTLLAECDSQLEKLIEAVAETGQGGVLTLKLPFKVNKAGQLECDPDVSAKLPRRALGTGIYYATGDGRLTRRDPNQADWIDDGISARRGAVGDED